MKTKILPQNLKELKKIIDEEMELNGGKCDLNHIDVSNITDMSYLFSTSAFNSDISQWDVSNIKDMSSMFYYSQFNGDISQWDVSKVESMRYMFNNAQFNSDISKWDVSNVKTMDNMFEYSKFNHDLTNWKPMSLTLKDDIFYGSSAPVPYWVKAEDTPRAVKELIISKQFEKMNASISDKDLLNKRIKI